MLAPRTLADREKEEEEHRVNLETGSLYDSLISISFCSFQPDAISAGCRIKKKENGLRLEMSGLRVNADFRSYRGLGVIVKRVMSLLNAFIHRSHVHMSYFNS